LIGVRVRAAGRTAVCGERRPRHVFEQVALAAGEESWELSAREKPSKKLK
jgi:hypothetical protein